MDDDMLDNIYRIWRGQQVVAIGRPSVVAGEEPPVTIDQILQWLPPWVAQEFTCPAGPHRWQVVGGRQYCMNCPAHRRHQEAA